MADQPPKSPNDRRTDELIGALEAALMEARARVAEAIDGLRTVIRGRQAGKLADDSGRYARPKARARPTERRKPKQR